MPTAAAVLIASTRAGPSIAATSAIPPTCRCRHRRPVSASRCGGSTAATRPADAAPSRRRLDLLAPRARRTRRLGEAQARVGLACGGAGGARLLAHLHMPASRATVLRSSPACRCPTRRLPSGSASTTGRSGRAAVTARSSSTSTVTASSISSRSHGTYGGRLARTALRRRTRRPGSLDRVCPRRKPRRAPGATGRRPMAPAHQHAAGRRRWLHGAHARLRSLPLLPGSTARPVRRNRAFARSTTELEAGAQSRMRWQAIYDEVRRRHAGGEPLLAIARALGLARATVRKYASAEAFPARLPHVPGRACLIRTSHIWRDGSTRAARTPWPCDARSENGATRDKPASASLRRRAPNETVRSGARPLRNGQ